MAIRRFYERYRFLSNFHPAPVVYDGYEYDSTEHAFVAAKTLDPEERAKIRAIKKPGAAKRAGRKLKLRDDWEDVKVNIMAELVLQKFARHPKLRDMLLETGDEELVEGNTWHDYFWGVCNGKGKNMLGKILMRVRELLKG